ncbi:T9SS type A sorting domain-containing protein [Carboxylicivirga sp. M1479]|uniref:T9SS type A sorting domain-containing protein n=1 Tax=Carboxylicivirga sp. M1479 TaxID=2594476 RepID=UPI001178507D|nr:T9SS type A sorting domain-containing protein [Carboxylicivirga sp. M1479]TRX71809.1 T9SS type A sorting domain-containing protein [Carboxylicivirga sp. M1479]
MKYRNLVLILFIAFAGVLGIYGQNLTLPDGSALSASTSSVYDGNTAATAITSGAISGGTVTDTVIVKIEGDLHVEKANGTSELKVNEHCILIITGDLFVGSNKGNGKLTLDGVLVVYGSVLIDAANTAIASVESSGTFAVGGSYTSIGDKETETNNGNVYLSDEGDGSGFGGTGTNGDLGGLIDSGILPGEILDDFVENVDGDNIPVSSWQGDEEGSETDWNNPGNWDGGIVPTKGKNVSIPTNPSGDSNPDFFPLDCSNGKYYVWNMTIQQGANLSVPINSEVMIYGDLILESGANLSIENVNDVGIGGSQITVYGDIIVPDDANIVVNSSNNNPTSLIVNGEVYKSTARTTTGNITFEWTYNNNNWWFIGHPISNATLSNSYKLIRDGGGDYALYDYVGGASPYSKLSDKVSHDFSSISPIKGYLFKVKDDNTTLTMKGQVNNNSDYSHGLLDNDWQIVANPYPSYYQLPTEDETDVNADFYHTTGTVYVTHSTSNSDKIFYVYNTLMNIRTPSGDDPVLENGIIAPGQAFYVETYSTGNVKMRAANCVHDAAKSSLKSGKVTEENILRIKLKNANNSNDEAVIALHEQGTVAYTRMDSKQRFQTNSLSYVYSVVEENKAVINALPLLADDYSQTIGVDAKAGEHQLSIDGIESLTNEYELLLEDKLTGAVTPMLNSQTVYEFTSDAGTFDDRFVLHFKVSRTEIPTDIENKEEVDNGISIYVQNDKQLFITYKGEAAEKNVEVYSMSGQLLIKQSFYQDSFNDYLNIPSGIYLVKVSDGHKEYSEKIFIP